ncbi:MAG: DUF3575 domain-containing protein [Chitinophagaceae bacterium]|nr:DUF3575 domain-containing protein [Chitinophagaceae bacterium]
MKGRIPQPITAILLLPGFIGFAAPSFAQADSARFLKRFTIATDVILDGLNEKNLGIEWKFNPRWAMGASFALVDSSKKYSNHRLIRNHDKYPGRVYEGIAIKLNAKYYPRSMARTYLQLSLLYKNLHYDTAAFYDGWDKGGSDFRRANEQAHLYGADFIIGKECIVFKYVVLDFFCGLGFRTRFRTYNTYYSRPSNPGIPPISGVPPLGQQQVHQYYLSPILGIKIGGCFYTQ